MLLEATASISGGGSLNEIIEDHKRSGYKSMAIGTFRENKDKQFYNKLGGLIKEEKNIFLGDKEIPIVGYIWQDIRNIKI